MAVGLTAIAGGLALGWGILLHTDFRPVLASELTAEHSYVADNLKVIEENFKVAQASIETLVDTTGRAEFDNLLARLEQNGHLPFAQCQRYYELARRLHYENLKPCVS